MKENHPEDKEDSNFVCVCVWKHWVHARCMKFFFGIDQINP